jgi:hypothetical protein
MSMISQTLNNYNRSIQINNIANSDEAQIAKNFRSTKSKEKKCNKKNLDTACLNFNEHESFENQLKYRFRQRYFFRQR